MHKLNGQKKDCNPEKVMENIFANLDEDGNGVLTKEEFVNGCLSDADLRDSLTF